MHVDVFLAIDVVHLGTFAVAHPHRLRLGDLPIRRGAACKVLAGQRDEFGAAGLPLEEHSFLGCDQVIHEIGHWTLNHRGRHGGTSALSVD